MTVDNSVQLFVNKTTSILKNRKKRLYKVDSESTAVEIKQDKGKEENSNEVTEVIFTSFISILYFNSLRSEVICRTQIKQS